MIFYNRSLSKLSNIASTVTLFLLCFVSINCKAAVVLTWDWDQPIHNVDGNSQIEMWATLSHDVGSTNDLVFGLFSVSIAPGTLIDNGGYSSGNPYTFELSDTIFADLNFTSSNPLRLGESIQFLYGTLTPKAGIVSGTYSTTNIDLGFSAAIWTTVESDFVVNVAAVPVPGAIILFGSGLIGLFRITRRLD